MGALTAGENGTLSLYASLPTPDAIAEAGTKAQKRFVEFFTAHIRNLNTRQAYGRATAQFFAWVEARGLTLGSIEPIVVAAYIEEMVAAGRSPLTVKQHLAAIRMLFDWLVTGGVLQFNPAASVKGPKYSYHKGKTQPLDREAVTHLIESIETDSLIGLRDRALIGTFANCWGRVSAICGMQVKDYYPHGKLWFLRLHEKGGKLHEIPANHKAQEYLDEYIEAAGIAEDREGALFRSRDRKQKALTQAGINRVTAFRIVKRRAEAAGITAEITCHTFRATGITEYLKQGGALENAQFVAAHSDPKTTKLYDHSGDEVSLTEMERVSF